LEIETEHGLLEAVVVDTVAVSEAVRDRGVLNGSQKSVNRGVGGLRRESEKCRFRHLIEGH
jgi:hypothetical protein